MGAIKKNVNKKLDWKRNNNIILNQMANKQIKTICYRTDSPQSETITVKSNKNNDNNKSIYIVFVPQY